MKNTQVVAGSKYVLGRGDRFPTDRRPEKRKLSTEVDEDVIE